MHLASRQAGAEQVIWEYICGNVELRSGICTTKKCRVWAEEATWPREVPVSALSVPSGSLQVLDQDGAGHRDVSQRGRES